MITKDYFTIVMYAVLYDINPMKKKPENPAARLNRVLARVNNEELQEIIKRALLYANGNLSKYLRLAALNYRGGGKK